MVLSVLYQQLIVHLLIDPLLAFSFYFKMCVFLLQSYYILYVFAVLFVTLSLTTFLYNLTLYLPQVTLFGTATLFGTL